MDHANIRNDKFHQPIDEKRPTDKHKGEGSNSWHNEIELGQTVKKSFLKR